jgi:hypothetical protein
MKIIIVAVLASAFLTGVAGVGGVKAVKTATMQHNAALAQVMAETE